MNISIEPEIKALCPDLTLGIITCHISNTAYNALLWEEINRAIEDLKGTLEIADINKIPIIKATRTAYKKCGKDPNRYRASSEALTRRIISGKGLYQINTGVDLINLVSFKTGYSIGAFDAEAIVGELNYGIGQKDEIYEGIGRGNLNIEGLPILRDGKGGIGTPTSDEERTKLKRETTSLLVNINGFLGTTALKQVTDYTCDLLQHYLNAQTITRRYIT